MDTSAVRRVLDRYYRIMNAHDLDGIAEVVAEDVVFADDFFPDVVFHGVAEFRGVFEGVWTAFPDFGIEIVRGPLFAEDTPQWAVHGRLTGTLAGAVPDWGFTKVGGRLELEFMACYEIDGDRVSSIRACLNPAIAARQLATA